MKKYILSASFTFCMSISCCETDWGNHYVEGVKLYQDKKYEKAGISFSKAIELTKNEKKESHIFILTNRAKNSLELGLFYKTIEDINEVIDCPSLPLKDLIDALEVRMAAYTFLGMHSKFQEDHTWYKSLNPFLPTFEYTEKYVIIRNCEMMKESNKEFTYGLFVAAGLCSDESKINRFNDTIIIERNPTHPCPCESRETKDEKEKDIDEEIRKEQKKQQMESCYWHCNLAARIASEIAGKLIMINRDLFGMMITIEILKHGCEKCCGDNGGFYMNCIQPVSDYCELTKIKLMALLNFKKITPRDRK